MSYRAEMLEQEMKVEAEKVKTHESPILLSNLFSVLYFHGYKIIRSALSLVHLPSKYRPTIMIALFSCSWELKYRCLTKKSRWEQVLFNLCTKHDRHQYMYQYFYFFFYFCGAWKKCMFRRVSTRYIMSIKATSIQTLNNIDPTLE